MHAPANNDGTLGKGHRFMKDHGFDIQSLPNDTLIRLLADDELTEEERASAEARLRDAGIDTSAYLDFERELRASTARSLRETTTPMDLRERIEQSLRAEEAGEPGVIRTPQGDTTRQTFWKRASRIAAVAAMLAIVGVLVFRSGVFTSRPFSQEFQTQLVSFVQASHSEYEAHPESRAERLPETTVEGGIALAEQTLGSLPPGLADGIETLREREYAFIGTGTCETPSGVAAVQVLFESPRSGSFLSVFVETDTGTVKAEPHCCYVTDCSELGDRLAVWRSEGFVYYTYGDDNSVVEDAREALNAPDHTRGL